MDDTIKSPGGPMKVTTEESEKFEPSITSHEKESNTVKSSYSAKIITPADSLIATAWETMPRSGGAAGASGSAFGERLSHLGASVSHLLSDWTHTLTVRASDTFDMISHTAHDLTDVMAHADFPGMVDETRKSIRRSPQRTLAVATGVGLALALLLKRKRS